MKPIDLARLFLLAALWGSSYLFIRITVPALGVFFTISLRVIVAACALSLYGLFTQQLPNLKTRWLSYFLLGLLNNAIPFILIAIAVANLNASIAAILNATTPLFTAIIAAIWLKEPLDRRKIVGLLLGIVGVAILVGWSPLSLSLPVIIGWISALIAALFYGIAAVYARRKFMDNRATETAIGQLIGSSVLLFPATFVSIPSTIPSSGVILAVVTLATVCTAFAYLLYFQLISNAGATPAATVTFLIPVFSLLFGKMLLSEPVNFGVIVGLLTILLSIRLVISKEH
ncbi:DMT family transporter [Gloeocapsopsis sp. IPPAS B-1203]|uniref:DMT family transporter n=1 Tax=Gloeocapsopsis sp. IPPAS B-1203 TaxID=2049454 RepID=UPI000C188596|nr:DMT family transporter [Gloeocapsopsis sp. IPPAS B-1203]PIG93935.1 EamA family transporter [Gloeocapsopsis sp. IPPAS B-1203]